MFTRFICLFISPGVYCSASGAITINSGKLYLDGAGNSKSVFIFQTATTVITGGGIEIVLQNGIQAANVFWIAGSGVTVGSSAIFIGNILAHTQITLGTTSVINGRTLAQTEVAFDGGSTIYLPTQAVPTGQPSGQPSSIPSKKPILLPISIPSSSVSPSGDLYFFRYYSTAIFLLLIL